MSRADDTRAAILSTAERMFAEHGVEAVSLRDISAMAGQRNTSAVIYHFGDRLGLLAAVMERRLSVINVRRAEVLAEIDAAGRGHTLRGIIEALVIPDAEHACTSGSWYARFSIRCHWSDMAAEVVKQVPSAALSHSIVDRLRAALSYLPPSIRRYRMALAEHHFLSGIADWEWSRDRGRRLLPADVLIAELVLSTVAMLEAPYVRNLSEVEDTEASLPHGGAAALRARRS